MPEDYKTLHVRLSEAVLVLQNDLQQAIEYLSLPEIRKVSDTSPGGAFVFPDKIRVRLPVVFEPLVASVPKDLATRFPIPIKPLIRVPSPDTKAAVDTTAIMKIDAWTPSDRQGTPAKVVGELEIEFVIAAK